MWREMTRIAGGGAARIGSLGDQLRTLERQLILTVGGIFAALFIVTSVHPDNAYVHGVWLASPVFVVASWTAYKLLARRPFVAQVVWQLGLGLALLIVLRISQWPQVAVLFVLLPPLAVVTFGWGGGLVAWTIVLATLIGATGQPAMPGLTPGLRWAVLIGGAVAGVLAWVVARELYSLVAWSAADNDRIWARLEAARQDRLELAETKQDLIDAAKIDGCGEMGVYSRVVLPLIKPGLAVLGIFTFVNNWNDLFWPLIVLNKREMYTLPVGLPTLQGQWTDFGLLMAGATLAALPTIVIFLAFQRYFVQGVTVGALKG